MRRKSKSDISLKRKSSGTAEELQHGLKRSKSWNDMSNVSNQSMPKQLNEITNSKPLDNEIIANKNSANAGRIFKKEISKSDMSLQMKAYKMKKEHQLKKSKSWHHPIDSNPKSKRSQSPQKEIE